MNSESAFGTSYIWADSKNIKICFEDDIFLKRVDNTYVDSNVIRSMKLKKDGVKLLRNEKLKLDLGKLKTCLLEPEKMECIGKENIDKLIAAIKTTKNINDIVLVAQIGDMVISASQLYAVNLLFSQDPNLILEHSFFRENLLEMKYGTIAPEEIKSASDFKVLFDSLKCKLKYRIATEEPCLFISNELFFGKDTVWPPDFHLIIPQPENNVVSCINFLTKNTIENKEEAFPVCRLSDKEPLFFSETHKDLPYKNHKDICTLPVICNTSKLFYSSKLFSEYIKSSYFMESETALDNGYVYLFGTRCNKKLSANPLTDLISNQICRDLVCGVRLGQEKPGIPIHIIQSNTLDIHPYIFNLQNIDYIPGKPNIVIHVDPLWTEVLVASHDDRVNFASDKKITPTDVHNITYKNARPVYEFKFSLFKKDYVDCYTITHWVLNAEPQQYRSFPLEAES